MIPASVADPFYYLANFQALLDNLVQRDGDLLASDEAQFIAEFAVLPPAPRALLVRMVMRKGVLFRASRLAYPEIPDPGEALHRLVGLGWVGDDPSMTVADLFKLFGKAAVVRYLDIRGPRSRSSVSSLIDSLRGAHPESRPPCAWHGLPDRVYELRIRALCRRLTLMFFGNFRQDLSEFVLADLKVFRYECVRLEPDSRPFSTRRQVEAFHQLDRCREMLHAGADSATVEAAVPPPIHDSEWLEDRRQKLRFQIARGYEKSGERDRAATVYASCTHPEARRRAERLCTSGAALPRPVRASPGIPVFELALLRSGDGLGVEAMVRDRLQSEASEPTQVLHVENALVNSLFGLLCWTAVFAPVRGAFFHRFHREPADLWSTGFVDRRRGEFDACFGLLRNGLYRDVIMGRFSLSHGTASPFVAWGLLDETLLNLALDCFPADHLRLWFEWIVGDLRGHRAGFPDLVQFFPREARYRLVEVKGPRDRLQPNQRACAEYMVAHGMPVSICRVRWAGEPAEVAQSGGLSERRPLQRP